MHLLFSGLWSLGCADKTLINMSKNLKLQNADRALSDSGQTACQASYSTNFSSCSDSDSDIRLPLLLLQLLLLCCHHHYYYYYYSYCHCYCHCHCHCYCHYYHHRHHHHHHYHFEFHLLYHCYYCDDDPLIVHPPTSGWLSGIRASPGGGPRQPTASRPSNVAGQRAKRRGLTGM